MVLKTVKNHGKRLPREIFGTKIQRKIVIKFELKKYSKFSEFNVMTKMKNQYFHEGFENLENILEV